MTWHVWGAYPGDSGPFHVYAAPDSSARTDGQDWDTDRAGLPHLGTVDNDATLTSAGDDDGTPIFQPTGDDLPGLVTGIGGYFPDDAKGWTGRGVATTYGPA